MNPAVPESSSRHPSTFTLCLGLWWNLCGMRWMTGWREEAEKTEKGTQFAELCRMKLRLRHSKRTIQTMLQLKEEGIKGYIGATRYLQPPSALTLGIGGTALCRVADIHTSMWRASTCGATGAESTKMWRL